MDWKGSGGGALVDKRRTDGDSGSCGLVGGGRLKLKTFCELYLSTDELGDLGVCGGLA